MHQYTADFANRAALGSFSEPAAREPADVSLLTTATFPRDRYSPGVQATTPFTATGTGFSREGLDMAAFSRVRAALLHQARTVYHFTGVHLWNVPLVRGLMARGALVLHTLHDLDPHHGVRLGRLIRLWNRLIIGSGAHILVHARRYRDRLLAAGLPEERVTAVPLLHGFWGWETDGCLSREAEKDALNVGSARQPLVLFFGRIEDYKGIDTLLAAWRLLTERAEHNTTCARLVIAGPLANHMRLGELPPRTEVRDRRIGDDEGIELFRQAALLVLPYHDATQSALIAAAYRFGVPVLATSTGALPEYVVPGETGWLVPPDNAAALAAGLREALSDSACLRRMGMAGKAWFWARRREEETALANLYGRLAARAAI
jgi:glycosyltransferase involved in cell wall biosynthesis